MVMSDRRRLRSRPPTWMFIRNVDWAGAHSTSSAFGLGLLATAALVQSRLRTETPRP